LVWTDLNWIDYVSDKKVFTYVFKDKNEIAGYFELIIYYEKKRSRNCLFWNFRRIFWKKIRWIFISEAIKNHLIKHGRVWVHTCSLDHKNALKNYLARGMKIFKTET
jgi:hypothetical protein